MIWNQNAGMKLTNEIELFLRIRIALFFVKKYEKVEDIFKFHSL